MDGGGSACATPTAILAARFIFVFFFGIMYQSRGTFPAKLYRNIVDWVRNGTHRRRIKTAKISWATTGDTPPGRRVITVHTATPPVQYPKLDTEGQLPRFLTDSTASNLVEGRLKGFFSAPGPSGPPDHWRACPPSAGRRVRRSRCRPHSRGGRLVPGTGELHQAGGEGQHRPTHLRKRISRHKNCVFTRFYKKNSQSIHQNFIFAPEKNFGSRGGSQTPTV